MLSAAEVYKLGTLLVLHLFLLTLFHPLTILFFQISLLLAYLYLKLRIKKLLRDGLIVYLPERVQQGLMERSLFDMLCDIWFMPANMNILKVLTKPFFTSIQPDQAALVLNDLSPEVRKQFLTKGIVNIFPDNLKGVLVSSAQKTQPKKQLSLVVSPSRALVLASPIKSQKPKQQSVKESTSDTLNNRKKGDKLRSVMHKQFQDQKMVSPPTHSSSITNVEDEQQKIEQPHHKWDKLEIYQNIKERLNSGESILQIVKSNIGIVKNLIHIKSTFFTNISAWKVSKVFLLFLGLLVFQMKLTNQNRKMIVNVMRATIGLTTVLGLVGSAGLLVYKFGYSRRKNNYALKEK